MHGWPVDRKKCTAQTIEYWTFREDLAVEDGLLFKNEQMMIPECEIAGYLKDLHKAHQGEERRFRSPGR